MSNKNMKRKFLSALLSLVMVVSLCLPAGATRAMAEETNAVNTICSYTAFGDSVATGYGPLEADYSFPTYYFKTGEGAYPDLIKDSLGISDENYHSVTAVQLMIADVYYLLGGEFTQEQQTRFEDKNLGYHDDEYEEIMKNYRNNKTVIQYIASSDLITIAVGNMDIMVEPINRSNGADGKTDQTILMQKVQQGLEEYAYYLPLILQRIYAINPQAKVLLFSQYDSHSKLIATEEGSMTVKGQVNAINAKANQIAASVTAKFGQSVPGFVTYVDISGLSEYIDDYTTTVTSYDDYVKLLSPGNHENHPGAVGHQWLRDKVLDVLGIAKPVKLTKSDADVSYLAFSSDVHTTDNEYSLKRLNTWLTQVSKSLGNKTFDYMGFTGDLAAYNYGGLSKEGGRPCTPVYWNKVARLMDTIELNPYVTQGIYTTGNHDYDSAGYLRYLKNDNNKGREDIVPYKNIQQFGEAANTDLYQIYCFGANSGSQKFYQSDITNLENYLESCDTNKPVFIMSHYPLHAGTGATGSRSVTENANAVIQLLNNYPNAIFLWGHNHTISDTYYDKITTDNINGTSINFTYASAGCMSDGDYSEGSGNVEGKGLVAMMDGSSNVVLTYYDENANVVSTATVSVESNEIAEPESDPLYPLASSLEDGKVYVIATTDTKDNNSYALGTEAFDGYQTNNGSNYQYSGLKGITVEKNSSGLNTQLDGSNYWIVETTSDGYAFKNFESGEYLTESYNKSVSGFAGVGKLETSTTSESWTYSSATLTGKNSGKVLQYQSLSDIDGNLTSGGADFFTIRSGGYSDKVYDEIYFYDVSDNMQNIADIKNTDSEATYTKAEKQTTFDTEEYKKYKASDISNFKDGDEFVVAYNKTVMSAEADDGYTTTASDGLKYSYSGLKPQSIDEDTSSSSVTALTELPVGAEVFTLKKASSGNWYMTTVQNGTTYYLAATYGAEGDYNGAGKVFLTETESKYCEWIFTSGSSSNEYVFKIQNSGCGKYLTYNKGSDVSGTIITPESKDSVSVFTVRSSASHSLYAFGRTCNYEYVLNGKYVIVNADSYALSSETGVGYNDSSSAYRYDGLKPTLVTVTDDMITSGADDTNSFTFTPNADGTYYIQSSDGRYLNGIYTRVANGTENNGIRLYLDSTPFAWTMTDDYALGFADGSSSRYISLQTNGGTTEVYTLRSSGNENHFTFYEITEIENTSSYYFYMTEGKGSVSARSQVVEEGQSVESVTATPAAGYVFDGWYDEAGTKVSSDTTFTADAAGTYTAKFTAQTTTIKYAAKSGGKVSVTSEAASATETAMGSTATADTGYKFLYWTSDSEGLNKVSTNASFVPDMEDGAYQAVTYYAWFEKNCSEGGDHDYVYVSNNDGTHSKKCTKCNEISGAPANCDQAITLHGTTATCAKNGLTDGAKCSACGYVTKAQETISKSTIEHSYSVESEYMAATCTSNGVNIKVCAVCGDKKMSYTEKLSHTYEEHAAKDATEDEDGNLLYYTCTTCDTVFDADKAATTLDAVTIKATGHTHNLVKTDAVAATYEATGTEAYWTCTTCDKMYSDDEATTEITEPVQIPMLQHLKIVTQPADYVGKIGDTATFKVDAIGEGLTYQWYYSKNGVKWYASGLEGANTDTMSLLMTEIRIGQMYKCVVTDAISDTETSEVAVIVRESSCASIVTQPTDQCGKVGDTVVFRLEAIGEGLTYQWYYTRDGERWIKSGMSGYNTDSISVPVTTARYNQSYKCVVTDASGYSVTSDIVSIKKTSVQILVQPKSVEKGVLNKTYEFTVTANGKGLTYQWYYSKNNGEKWYKSSLEGYNTDTIKVKLIASRNGQLYRCVITDEEGNEAVSDAATLCSGSK